MRPAGTCDIKPAEDMQLAHVLLRRLRARDVHAASLVRDVRDGAHGLVCASSQSSTVPYQWMLLLGFSTQ